MFKKCRILIIRKRKWISLILKIRGIDRKLKNQFYFNVYAVKYYCFNFFSAKDTIKIVIDFKKRILYNVNLCIKKIYTFQRELRVEVDSRTASLVVVLNIILSQYHLIPLALLNAHCLVEGDTHNSDSFPTSQQFATFSPSSWYTQCTQSGVIKKQNTPQGRIQVKVLGGHVWTKGMWEGGNFLRFNFHFPPLFWRFFGGGELYPSSPPPWIRPCSSAFHLLKTNIADFESFLDKNMFSCSNHLHDPQKDYHQFLLLLNATI